MTLGNLRAQVRFLLADPSTGWLSDANLNTQINLAMAAIYQLIVRNNENYFATSGLITLVSGTETYTLPTTTRVLNISRVDQTVEYDLQKIDITERVQYLYPTIGGTTAANPYGLRYYLLGNTIGLVPVPTEAATDAIRVYHVPSSTALSGDSVSPPLEWPLDQQEVIALGAARRCHIRDKDLRQSIDGMYLEYLKNLMETTSIRSSQDPRMFIDVDRE